MLAKELWLNFPPHLSSPSIRSLSILSILDELSKTFELILDFQKKAQSNPNDLVESESFLHFFSLLQSFPKTGIFPDKICFYSDILQKASKIENNFVDLVLEEIRSEVLHLRFQISEWKKKTSKHFEMQSNLVSMLQMIQEKQRLLFTAFLPFLREAKTDENVLLSLIEKRKLLNPFIAPLSIEKLLQEFFPNGHTHLKATIHEGFIRRGFSAFLSEKELLIDAIEWDSNTICEK